MPLVTRAVFGFVYRTDGTAIAAAPVSIRSFAGVYQPDGSVAPATLLTPITNSVGRYDVVLVVNARYLIGIPGDVFEIIVPSGAGSISVESLRATTGVLMSNAVQIALDAVLAVHATLTTTAHGGLVAAGDGRLTDARTPTGTAGGVLSGTYPNPGFAADLATQAELDAALLTKENALGNPGAAGQFLTSTLGGGRSWASLPSGGAVVHILGAAGEPVIIAPWENTPGETNAWYYVLNGWVHVGGNVRSSSVSTGQTMWTMPASLVPPRRTYGMIGIFATICYITTGGVVTYGGPGGGLGGAGIVVALTYPLA